MLVFNRRVHEQIVIGEDIVVTVVRVERHRVRLGIKAPKHDRIYRKELYERIRDQKRLDQMYPKR